MAISETLFYTFDVQHLAKLLFRPSPILSAYRTLCVSDLEALKSMCWLVGGRMQIRF